MERPRDQEPDPRQEALEEAAFTAWQFAASFQRLPFHEDIEPVRPPSANEWRHAADLIHRFDLEASVVEGKALDFFHETVMTLYPSHELEFFQKRFREAIRANRYHKAKRAIRGAVRKRMLLEE